MKKLITKAILLIVCFQFAWVARAQYATEFYLTDLSDAQLKEKVQQSIGKLLTEINTAQANDSQPYFSGLSDSPVARVPPSSNRRLAASSATSVVQILARATASDASATCSSLRSFL